MRTPKTNDTRTLDQNFKDYPADVRKRLQTVREIIRKAAPKAEEAIRWDMPTFILEGNLVHFCGFKNHIGFFPGSDAIAAFKKEIAKFKNSKGTVQFQHDEPLPVGLISRITKYCVKRNLMLGKAKLAKKTTKKQIKKTAVKKQRKA
jgi:uncharacterized protein YdhG (YjbR/CyaY superfamily)